MAIKTFTTGEVLTSSDTNTYLANSGLVYVASVVATSGTNIDISNCFTSIYDSYRVVISNYTTTTASGLDLQLMVSGSPTTTGYYYAYIAMTYANSTAYDQKGASIAAAFSPMAVNNGSVASGSYFDLFNPQKANKTTIIYFRTDTRTPAEGGAAGPGTGWLNNNTQYDGLRLVSNATITNCRVTVYGYRQA